MVRTPRLMAAAGVACVVAFFALLGVAYYVHAARYVDGASLYGFVSVGDSRLGDIATVLAAICNPAPFAVLAIGAIAAATKLRGLRYGAAAAVLLVGANVTSQLAKPALAHYRDVSQFHGPHMHAASFPSGHATASMSLALVAILLAPRAYRPIVAVAGAAFTIAVSFSVVLLGWHYPSDVVGGFLVATGWCCAALAALGWSQARWPDEGTMRRAARGAIASAGAVRVPRALVWAGIGSVAIGAAAAGAHVDLLATFATRYAAFVVVASAIAVSAVVLLAGVTKLTSR